MTALIEADRLLDVLETETTLLAAATVGADPDRPVPGCPGLTAGETARHLGSVYRMALTWIRTGDRPTRWQRQPLDGEPLEHYLRDGLRALLGELESHPPDASCPTWHPENQTYGFWRRRMAHEATVHRIDVQGAVGEPITPVPEDVAVDGVDEVLTLWFTHRLAVLGVSGTRATTVAVRTAGHTWLAEVTTDRTTASPAPLLSAESAAATVTGPPQELYLWLWGRSAVFSSAVEREGDLDALTQLWALLRLATR
ncbi:maleylpyruvate isomerase family mycothiol-dependent enzyme [Actinokineospora diospyrosa]|uniref:TIGR03083 family protein n=1 Tax=Actinokineospora diospyrosa TaxID=103728 RepID=A0ABT1I4J7_9PSEU|nr:maleylpyruvate isomerase family mycothiol-dependent enzyme [Actinokineospora diospyrosa]MCP2267543.1 TIGR03083 family protein [Actinokineospora diospyrosa]